jgi:radical SAM superfamily enzyme YgiQ (UPF0313 family)
MSGDRLQLDRRRGLALHEARPAGFGAGNPSDRIDTAHPRALFLEISEENRDPVLRLAAKCGRRHPGTLILVGGIPATLAPGSVFERCAHVAYIVEGEREATFLEAVVRMRQHLLQTGLELRDRYAAGEMSEHGIL